MVVPLAAIGAGRERNQKPESRSQKQAPLFLRASAPLREILLIPKHQPLPIKNQISTINPESEVPFRIRARKPQRHREPQRTKRILIKDTVTPKGARPDGLCDLSFLCASVENECRLSLGLRSSGSSLITRFHLFLTSSPPRLRVRSPLPLSQSPTCRPVSKYPCDARQPPLAPEAPCS